MNKLVSMVVGMAMCGAVAAADNPPSEQMKDFVLENMADRWEVTCTGQRVGGDAGESWSLIKSDMPYGMFGMLSHNVIHFINTALIAGAVKMAEEVGVGEKFRIVE